MDLKLNKWLTMTEVERELAYNPKKAVVNHEIFQNLATRSAAHFRKKIENVQYFKFKLEI